MKFYVFRKFYYLCTSIPVPSDTRRAGTDTGEMLEWLKRHAWKACIRQNRISGSNPDLSAANLETQGFAKLSPGFAPKNAKSGVLYHFLFRKGICHHRRSRFFVILNVAAGGVKDLEHYTGLSPGFLNQILRSFR